VYNHHTIRKAYNKDIDSIFLLEKNIFAEESWTIDMINEELQESLDKMTWVMEKFGNIVAYCMIRIIDKEIHIINMAVKSALQGNGLGRLLLTHIFNYIPDKSSVFLEVKQGNFPAINLYLSFGFEEIYIRDNYYQDGSNAIIMCYKN
tara:strand:- start:2641 stop:3084 length:444 start_codon:yes stop_codon:yes gene_type:complete